MIRSIIAIFLTLFLFNSAAWAETGTAQADGDGYKDGIGLGAGAILGGLNAGPPGAIIGAAAGGWFGDREERKDARLAEAETQLLQKQTEAAALENRLADLQKEFASRMRKVKLQSRTGALEPLSQSLSTTVYFRTGSAAIEEPARPGLVSLANFLKDYPEIQLHLEAHADVRGSEDYNKSLSTQRARAVEQILLEQGMERARIHTHGHGESRARADSRDTDGQAFDRRVNIFLTLDTQV